MPPPALEPPVPSPSPSSVITAEPSAAPETQGPMTLQRALAGEWRAPGEIARDDQRNLQAILDALTLDPGHTLVEFWPGAGADAAVIAPVLAEGGGRYVGVLPAVSEAPNGAEAQLNAAFERRFSEVTRFGVVDVAAFGPRALRSVPDGQADRVLTVRDIHAWMALGLAEHAFAAAYSALKPGGIFVVVEAETRDIAPQNPRAPDGYVRRDYVIVLAEEAGFVLRDEQGGLDNAADDTDHPFGVWTLAPFNRTAALNAPGDPAFDRALFDAIGEPRRMLLVFEKPTGASTD